MEFKHFFHILNPNKSHRSSVRRFFRTHPEWESAWVERASHPQHLETIVDWALLEGKTDLAVWGGDGTLSRVVQALHRNKKLTGVRLALVPVGTCNDFARKIGIGSWLKWIRHYQNNPGLDRRFDAGLLESGSLSRIFVNNAGFGRTPAALSGPHRSNPLKDIASFTEKTLQLEWGTEALRQYATERVFFGIVFNSPYFNKGMYFQKSIAPDDGKLNAFFVPPQSQLSMILRFLKSKCGGGLSRPSDISMEATFLNVDSDQPLFPQADGEPVSAEGIKQIKFSIMRQALAMIIPSPKSQRQSSSS